MVTAATGGLKIGVSGSRHEAMATCRVKVTTAMWRANLGQAAGAGGSVVTPSANAAVMLLAVLVLTVVGPMQTATTSTPGCVSHGKWYPEGARIAPDPRSRIAVAGTFVCRHGKWVFEKA
jgi:hypothetical protein